VTGKKILPAFRLLALAISILLRVSLQYQLLKLHYQSHTNRFNKITYVNPYVLSGSRHHCCEGNTTIRPLLIVIGALVKVNNTKASAVTNYHKLMTKRSQNVFLYLSG